MTEPRVSERMFNLVTDFGADCINYGCNQLRPMVGYPLVKNVQHRAKEAALYAAIAEIEQRAEKTGASAETIEVLADVIRKHHADIVIADAEGEPKADDDTWVVCAINELGRQRGRAEKWKEVALAKSLLEIARCTSNFDEYPMLLKHAVEREKAAIAALGDEWERAVKGEE